ncbi:MAG: hypothetical protein KF720_16570 [Rubrivivax sp.]|nr:hypothetical protein [Rubrivivax sp.]
MQHLRRGQREHLAGAAGDAEHRQQPDRQQRGQLDHGFERDRGDDAVVALLGVDVARAEEHGEHRHAHGDPEADLELRGTVVRAGQRVRAAVADDLEARRHGLQLQRDVRCGADHGDQRDQRRQAGALAVTRGHHVGDRGDALRMRDAHDLAQQHPPADEHQRRAEIDGDEFQAAARRRADRAVEGP